MEKLHANNSLIIVDTIRCFMPESEGERLGLPGFGELPVNGAEQIIPNINRLTRALGRSASNLVIDVREAHPEETAHFSETPNFVDTWPPHGRQGTPGAEPHPDLLVAQHPELTTTFIKGDIPCKSPADDTSYTGFLAHHPDTGITLPDYLSAHEPDTNYVVGVAIGDGADHPLCVDSTARDFHEAGFNVALVTDAVEAISPENREICFRNMAKRGIRLVTTDQALAEILGEES